MTPNQVELYRRIRAFRFDPDGASFTFAQRLAKENGWSNDFTARVIEEYRRFAFLAASAGHPVSPSDTVDQAWHLHLVYTRSYWDEFCGKVLRTPLHHEPSTGGRSERAKFDDWYSRTLQSYRRFFAQDGRGFCRLTARHHAYQPVAILLFFLAHRGKNVFTVPRH